MTAESDQRREALRKFIKENDLKVATWAKQSGVSANSIYNFLNGLSGSLNIMAYGKLARTARVPVAKLTGEYTLPASPTGLWVAGHVQGGDFQDAVEWNREDWYMIDVPIEKRFQKKAKALEVRGRSMNLSYPEGSIAVWVDMLDTREPLDGDDVVVYCEAENGRIEATLKTLKVDENGKAWLWPNSSDPLHQAPLDTDNPPSNVVNIEIKGIVIGMYMNKFQ